MQTQLLFNCQTKTQVNIFWPLKQRFSVQKKTLPGNDPITHLTPISGRNLKIHQLPHIRAAGWWCAGYVNTHRTHVWHMYTYIWFISMPNVGTMRAHDCKVISLSRKPLGSPFFQVVPCSFHLLEKVLATSFVRMKLECSCAILLLNDPVPVAYWGKQIVQGQTEGGCMKKHSVHWLFFGPLLIWFSCTRHRHVENQAPIEICALC